MTRPPNILFVLTDQQRPDTIAALGNPLIRTPHLDRLVREGTAFDRAYTPSPVCVPARHALTTGRSPHRTGVADNLSANVPADPSIMEVLAARGYQTHGVGKMHFVPQADWRKNWGFESRDLQEECCLDDDYYPYLCQHGYNHVLDPHGLRSEYYYVPQPSQLPEHLHGTTWVADRSIDFLRRRDRARPFFLWTSFIKPHPPFESPNPWNRLYRSHEMPAPFVPENAAENLTFWNRVQNRYKYMDGGAHRHLQRTQRAAYYAAISFIDFQMGRILAALGPEVDDTLVVFTSDHGELLGDFGCYGKRSMLEPSARVPLIVRQPGRFAAGRRCAEPVSLLDLFPTFNAAAGGAGGVDGETSADLALVARGGNGRTHVLSQFSQRATGLYLAAERDWKYIYSAPDAKEWLFNTAADPRETENLAAEPACARHRDRLKQHLLNRYSRDGYTDAVERVADGRLEWRAYDRPSIPDDPEAGLLLQDPAPLADQLKRLEGYARPPAPPNENPGLTFSNGKPFPHG